VGDGEAETRPTRSSKASSDHRSRLINTEVVGAASSCSGERRVVVVVVVVRNGGNEEGEVRGSN
jgi:hypothetical protein